MEVITHNVVEINLKVGLVLPIPAKPIVGKPVAIESVVVEPILAKGRGEQRSQ